MDIGPKILTPAGVLTKPSRNHEPHPCSRSQPAFHLPRCPRRHAACRHSGRQHHLRRTLGHPGESALRGTPQFADAEIVNFGLGSETVSGLSEPGHASGQFPRPCLHERLGRILEAYKPTLVLACYGMNDGIYQPLDSARTKAYQDGCLKLR